MRVLIAGYYGFGNLGDELILQSILKRLKEKHPAANALVLSNHPFSTHLQHNVEAVNRWNPLSIIAAMIKADLFILGGGGLIQDGTSLASALYYLALVALARLSGTRTVGFALGVEHVSHPITRILISGLFQTHNVTISVRDEQSRDRLLDIGLSPERVLLTADPVFEMDLRACGLGNRTDERPQILFIPRVGMNRQSLALAQTIIEEIIKTYRGVVRMVLFQPLVEREYFQDLYKEGLLKVNSLVLSSEPEEIIREFQMADKVITTRYHAMILGLLAGKACLGIGDPHKVGRLSYQMGMPYLSWDATERDTRKALDDLHKVSPDSCLATLNALKFRAKLADSLI